MAAHRVYSFSEIPTEVVGWRHSVSYPTYLFIVLSLYHFIEMFIEAAG